MEPKPFFVEDTSRIISPALLIFRERLQANLLNMILIAKSVERLRPHCKTHKMPAVTRIELATGILRHKCSTIAEAEMLADEGVTDIFLAYNLVGPNIPRVVRFLEQYPQVRFMATADHPRPIEQLGAALSSAGCSMELLLDLDVGQHRTGVPVGPQAKELYRQINRTPCLSPGGFHVYDGHQHQMNLEERRSAILAEFQKVREFRDELLRDGYAVPRMVCGGTGSFPVYAGLEDPEIELSPGTCLFHDTGYSEMFPDLVFPPATAILTRVISRPTPTRITCDLGYKAVASDPPAGKRLTIPSLPDAVAVLQNEEHLVLETSEAERFSPGDELFAIPRHICPSVAMHKSAYVIERGKLVDEWEIRGRDRKLTI